MIECLFITIARLPSHPFWFRRKVPLVGIKVSDKTSLDPGLTKMRPRLDAQGSQRSRCRSDRIPPVNMIGIVLVSQARALITGVVTRRGARSAWRDCDAPEVVTRPDRSRFRRAPRKNSAVDRKARALRLMLRRKFLDDLWSLAYNSAPIARARHRLCLHS